MSHHSSTPAWPESNASPDGTPPTSWRRLILTWLIWTILVGLGWAAVPFGAAALAFATENIAPPSVQPGLVVNLGFTLALLWLVIGGLQLLCLAHFMRGTLWWRIRWLTITIVSGVGWSLFMAIEMVMSGSFPFDLDFTIGYVVWSLLTGAGQWFALHGRLRRLPRTDLLIWLGSHCLLPVITILLLSYLWRQAPTDVDTPLTLWHYFIGILIVVGPGLLPGAVTSALLLLMLRRARQSAINISSA